MSAHTFYMFRSGYAWILLSFIFFLLLPQHSFPQSLLEEGVFLFESGRYDEAKEKFSSYLSSHPTDAVALYHLGRAESDGSESQKYFRLLLEKNPSHDLADDALFEIGQFYYARGYYKTARKHFRRLLREYSGSNLTDRALYRIGLTFLGTGEPDSARGEFQRFLELYSVRRPRPLTGFKAPSKPSNGVYKSSERVIFAECGIVDSYFLEENYQGAVDYSQKLLVRDDVGPVKSHLLWTILKCYEEMGMEAEVREILMRIATECPTSYEATLARARSSAIDSVGRYTVQVGAFRDISNATNLYNRLTARAFKARVDTKVVDGQPFWLVRVGPYSTREEAENVAESIRKSEDVLPQVVEIR